MSRDLTHILNWRRWDDATTMSGQPSEDQLAEIKALGVRRVINLGPHTNDGALEDEPGTVDNLGMAYIYIPVDFNAPTEEDYAAFCDALEAVDGPTHVHCIYNARVSAFFYRYAKEGRGGDAARAFDLMDGIWRPGGVWATFIGDETSVDQPNRFEGYEYSLA